MMEKAMKIIDYLVAWIKEFVNTIMNAFALLSPEETTAAAE